MIFSQSACGSSAADTASEETAAAYQTCEFDTCDGDASVIDASNIVSREAVEDPLEWADLPADAGQIAPGRDFTNGAGYDTINWTINW